MESVLWQGCWTEVFSSADLIAYADDLAMVRAWEKTGEGNHRQGTGEGHRDTKEKDTGIDEEENRNGYTGGNFKKWR